MKSTSIYNTHLLGKFYWFAKRFGIKTMFTQQLNTLLAPVLVHLFPKQTFQFAGQTFEQFWHKHSTTWRNERCVEIPVVWSVVEQQVEKFIANCYPNKRTPACDILEVGNVLGHYFDFPHDVVDKFERAAGVQNVDIIEYAPNKKYHLIVSISTFEHIGYDDDGIGSSREKIPAAIANCRRLLTDCGKMLITVPLGYNPAVDALLLENALTTSSERFLMCVGRTTDNWMEVERDTALKSFTGLKTNWPHANIVAVLEFKPLC